MQTLQALRKVTIIRASDAFIYLPLYLAEDRNLFAQVQRSRESKGRTKYEFQNSKRSQNVGDVQALKEMYDLSTKNHIAFAVCDPLHLFDTGIDPKEFAVVGALIKQPPFWIVNSTPIHELKELRVQKLVSYSEDHLKTGNYLGRYVQAVVETVELESSVTDVGTELGVLLEYKQDGLECAAISADMLGLARANSLPKDHRDRLEPIFYFADIFTSFLTTAIVTTRKTCDDHPDAVSHLRAGLTNAIKTIYTTHKTVAELCVKLSAADFFDEQLKLGTSDNVEPLNEVEADWIAEKIAEHRIYPDDMLISREDWSGAAQADRRLFLGANSLESRYEDVVHPDARLEPTTVPSTAAQPPDDNGVPPAKPAFPKILGWIAGGLLAIATALQVALKFAPSPWIDVAATFVAPLLTAANATLLIVVVLPSLRRHPFQEGWQRSLGDWARPRARGLIIFAVAAIVTASAYLGEFKNLVVNISASIVFALFLLFRK